MNRLFLLYQAVEPTNPDEFKSGMDKLVAIQQRKDRDTFFRHHSMYYHPQYLRICSSFGPAEQVILRFLLDMQNCTDQIENEEEAELVCGNNPFAFLGTNFGPTSISEPRQVTDNASHQKWTFENFSNFEKLRAVLESPKCLPRFEKEFVNLRPESQTAILEDFQYAKSRGLRTPYYPDTNLVKDVSPSGSACKVYELRVSRPVELRVYFNEHNGVVHLASIDLKSNADQSADIKAAYAVLKSLTGIK